MCVYYQGFSEGLRKIFGITLRIVHTLRADWL